MSDRRIVERLREWPLSEKLAIEAADRIEALEAALRIFADDDNWRYGRRLDPNGSRFDGIAIAEASLTPEQNLMSDQAGDTRIELMFRLEAALKRIETLEAALQKIFDAGDYWTAIDAARAALAAGS